MTTFSPPQPIALTLNEIGQLDSASALGLARTLSTLGRPNDSLAVLMSYPFEKKTSERDGYLATQILTAQVSEAIELAASQSREGVRDILQAMRERGQGPVILQTYHMGDHLMFDGQHAHCGPLLDSLRARSLADAQTLIDSAPQWMSVIHVPDIHCDLRKPAELKGLAALLFAGAEGPAKILDHALSRDRLAERLAQRDRGLDRAVALIGRAFRQFDPALDTGIPEGLALCLNRVIDAALATPTPDSSSGSILPRSWISSLALGGFDLGRSIAFDRIGREACIKAASQEGSIVSDSKEAMKRGNLAAIDNCALCFGADNILLAHTQKLEKSAVAIMASSMPPTDFSSAIDRLIALGGRSALRVSCEHRFWAVFEQNSSVRKMGDALAYFAAEGLVEHARVLLDRLPDLDRKSVKEVLSYMNKRDSNNKGIAHSAWEAMLIRETIAPEAAAPTPSRRARL